MALSKKRPAARRNETKRFTPKRAAKPSARKGASRLGASRRPAARQAARKAVRRKRAVRRPLFETQRYNLRALHEDREYGLYWYAWLWRIARPVLVFLCSALMVVGMVATGYKWVYNHYFAPVDDQNAQVVTFHVEKGESATKIAGNLVEKGLLRNDRVFRYLVQFQGLTNQLSYGVYKLSPSMSVTDVIAELTSGSQTNERVITIVPGWTCEDIAEYLVSIGALEDSQEFLTLCKDGERFVSSSYALRDAQNNGTLSGRRYALEGYLSPDTYRVFTSATAESIIRTLLNQNNKVVDDVFYAESTQYYVDEEGVFHEVETYQHDLSMDEVIILASMIEKEAGSKADYGKVSAVFHNRLAQGWKLESDPTATYLTRERKLALSEEDMLSPSLYNTYYVDALPIGPICNPSKAAMEAAKAPDLQFIQDGYMYFCAMEPTSGQLAFSRTREEHDANVARYRPLWEEYDRQQALLNAQ